VTRTKLNVGNSPHYAVPKNLTLVAEEDAVPKTKCTSVAETRMMDVAPTRLTKNVAARNAATAILFVVTRSMVFAARPL
jgi:hypothetical protein